MRRLHFVADPEYLSTELQQLTTLAGKDLRVRYRSIYRSEPPPGLSRSLLLRALAYRLQETALGGLSRSTRRRLAKAASGSSDGPAVTPVPILQPQP
jgi:Protein of unknown function (DUF2924)